MLLDCEIQEICYRIPNKLAKVYQCTGPVLGVMLRFLYLVEATLKKIEKILVVQKFQDIFQEIVGLPSKRKLEFQIELILGARHVVKKVLDMRQKNW